mmetsp:Transcript_37522/g.96868  ORF Transcript_37522/g.96868 Transcript_37522/m.96868 type:complete len:87 (+) Transcript_37522:367-627(+)
MEVDRVLEDPAEAKLRGVFLNGERFTVLSAPSGQCLKAICGDVVLTAAKSRTTIIAAMHTVSSDKLITTSGKGAEELAQELRESDC